MVDGQFRFTTKIAMSTAVIMLPFNFPVVLFCWKAADAPMVVRGPGICDTLSAVASLC